MIAEWKRLSKKKNHIQDMMYLLTRQLEGKVVYFKFGNMTHAAKAVVMSADFDGDRILVRNVETGGRRRISPKHILPSSVRSVEK